MKYVLIDYMEVTIKSIRESSNENLYCVDCESTPTTFVIISYGIFICSSCAQIHSNAKLPYTSTIRSIKSGFTAQELEIIIKGGNSSFVSFLSVYNIPSISKIEFKYRTIACKYYREYLKALVLNSICEIPTPTMKEAVKLEPIQNSYSFLESIESKKRTLEGLAELNPLRGIHEKTSDLFKNIRQGFKVRAVESIQVFDKILDLGKETGNEIANKVRSGTDLIKQTAESGREKVESSGRFLIGELVKGRNLISDGVLYIRSASLSPSIRKKNRL